MATDCTQTRKFEETPIDFDFLRTELVGAQQTNDVRIAANRILDPRPHKMTMAALSSSIDTACSP